MKDDSGGEAEHFLPNRQSYEFAVGYRVNRLQTLKVGYEVFRTTDVPGSQDNVFGVQFVTSVHALSKAFGN